MFKDNRAYSGFAVDDIARARTFYRDVLGMDVSEENGMLRLRIGDGAQVLVYLRPGHIPAPFTVLNFPVADVEATVEALTAAGVPFLTYDTEHVTTDAIGIMRGRGPTIAWFTDPAGNILSVIESD